MKRLRYFFGFSLVSAAVLSGCAVYVPTVPSTPLVQKGQVEVTAGLRSFTSLEAGAAWAPTAHLLLVSESAFQSSTTTTTTTTGTNTVSNTYHDYHRQGSLGLGYYRAPTSESDYYLAVVGGIGFASTSLHAIDFEAASPFLPFPVPYISGEYQAHYRRYYGQVYAAQPISPKLIGGFSVRGTWVDYTHLTLDGQPLSPTNRLFAEPTLFLRFGQGPVQGPGYLRFLGATGRRQS